MARFYQETMRYCQSSRGCCPSGLCRSENKWMNEWMNEWTFLYRHWLIYARDSISRVLLWLEFLSCSHGFKQGCGAWAGAQAVWMAVPPKSFVLPQILLCPEKFVQNLPPLKIYFSPSNLKTWLRVCAYVCGKGWKCRKYPGTHFAHDFDST